MHRTATHLRAAATRQARAMRDKAVQEAKRRKEEYVGARVPRELKARVLKRADQLGIPVSLLIRNILEDAFKEATDSAVQRGEVATTGQAGVRYPNVLGWEAIRLNKKVDCSGCGRELSAGVGATLGLAEAGGKNVILCGRCVDAG